MARSVLVIGESGTGKSRSLKNLNPAETFLFNIIGKDLPFQGWKKGYTPYNKETNTGNMVITHDASVLLKGIAIVGSLPQFKNYIFDDFQYIMSYEFMARATERGYDKFSEIAQNAWNIIKTAQTIPANKNVVFLAHSEEIYGDGIKKSKIKTIGKLLDEKITVEGMFTVVLQSLIKTEDDKPKYVFATQSDGTSTVKSPEGMFTEKYIDNDIQSVLERMEQYASE